MDVKTEGELRAEARAYRARAFALREATAALENTIINLRDQADEADAKATNALDRAEAMRR